MSERIVTYVKVDVRGAGKINGLVQKITYDSGLEDFFNRIAQKFSNYDLNLKSQEGDAVLYKTGSSPNDAIKASIEICEENRKNPIVVQGIDENKAYRLDFKIIIVTGPEIFEENRMNFNPLIMHLVKIEEADHYLPNTVILDTRTFELSKDYLRSQKFVNASIKIKYNDEEQIVYYVESRRVGLGITKPIGDYLEEIKVLKKIIEDLKGEIETYKKQLHTSNKKLKESQKYSNTTYYYNHRFYYSFCYGI